MATSKGQIAYLLLYIFFIAYFFIAHVQNGHISTYGHKSDITIVFPNPDFL